MDKERCAEDCLKVLVQLIKVDILHENTFDLGKLFERPDLIELYGEESVLCTNTATGESFRCKIDITWDGEPSLTTPGRLHYTYSWYIAVPGYLPELLPEHVFKRIVQDQSQESGRS